MSWAWIQYTWWASAYDEDDWVCRVATMVQMVGVIILALGLPDMFASIDHGETLDNGVMVAGYVVMRVPIGVPVAAIGPAQSRTSTRRLHDLCLDDRWPRSAGSL